MSYAAVGEAVDRAAATWADLGVVKGDRVVFMVDNCPEFLIRLARPGEDRRHPLGGQHRVHGARRSPTRSSTPIPVWPSSPRHTMRCSRPSPTGSRASRSSTSARMTATTTSSPASRLRLPDAPPVELDRRRRDQPDLHLGHDRPLQGRHADPPRLRAHRAVLSRRGWTSDAGTASTSASPTSTSTRRPTRRWARSVRGRRSCSPDVSAPAGSGTTVRRHRVAHFNFIGAMTRDPVARRGDRAGCRQRRPRGLRRDEAAGRAARWTSSAASACASSPGSG